MQFVGNEVDKCDLFELISNSACNDTLTPYNAHPLTDTAAITRGVGRLTSEQSVKKLLNKALDSQAKVVRMALRFKD